MTYCQIYYIRRTKSEQLDVFRLVLQLPLCIILKPYVKSRMEMYLEQCLQALLQLDVQLRDQQDVWRYLDSI